VTTADGDPLPDFTIEIVAYDVGNESLVIRKDREPQMIGRFKAMDGTTKCGFLTAVPAS
jgi:hypothetical protein